MPTYEYECKKCKIFEIFQNISAPKLTTCPTCGGKVKRLLGTGAGLVFKGSGFYETDFKNKKIDKIAKPKNDTTIKTEKEKENK